MKKFTEIFGFILAIIIAYSSIAKANHYPGAGVGMALGLGVLLFPFLILFAISLYKENKPLPLLISGGISTMIYLSGFLFLIQHWPGGGFFIFIGLIFLLITLIIFGIIELSKEPFSRNYSVITISFIIMAASLLYAASFRSVGRGVINGLLTANEDLIKSTEMIGFSFITKYDKYYVQNPVKGKIYIELRNRSNELFTRIEAVKKKLASIANGSSDFSNYSTIKGLDIVDISNVYMIEEGLATEIKSQINNYRQFVIANDSVFHMKNFVGQFLNTQDPPPIQGDRITWESSKFLNVPVICAISNLSAIQLNIRTFELCITRSLE